LIWHTFQDMVGGEIYVKKIPSMNITVHPTKAYFVS